MRAYDIITKTKRGIALTDQELQLLIREYVAGNIPDYQIAAWLMAVCFQGLTPAETACLTLTMRDSGDVIDLSPLGCLTVDKHSTGGVGDKTSLILSPIVAACGVAVPKMSGRGLGHTGGTIDKLESIPGFRTDLPFDRFLQAVRTAGCAIVAQSGNLVPADKKLYALRDVTGTVDSIPLICASIMSKKLAMGADCIVLDVKMGSGAFMKTEADAVALGKAMVQVAQHAGKQCRAVITDMDAPLGMCIGNAIEVEEAITTLRGETTTRLGVLCLTLAAHMLELAGKGDWDSCYRMAEESIASGAALERFRAMIAAQGGNPRVTDDLSLLPRPAAAYEVTAPCSGYVTGMQSEEIGICAMELGAGRRSKDESLDLSAGIRLHAGIGDRVEAGAPLATLYTSRPQTPFPAVEQRLLRAVTLSDTPPAAAPLIRQVVSA